MQLCKIKVRKPSQILQQLNNRMHELANCKTNRKTTSIFAPKVEYLFDEFSIKSDSINDSYCMTKNNVPVKVIDIFIENGVEHVTCLKCLNII